LRSTSPPEDNMAARSAVIVALALQGASAFLTRGGPSPRALRARSAGRMAAKMQASPSPMAQNVMDFSKDDPYAFTACILGDLHIDPRYMEDYYSGREHFEKIIEEDKAKGIPVGVCSLGDPGESKAVEPNTSELFAGTTRCHEAAAEYLGSFGVPYEVVGGNHDLEGIDEFATDEENLAVYLKCHNKETPQFCRQIAEKTLLVGLGSTVFRDAKYTSHEVTVDDAQIAWFEELVESHPAAEGWRVIVFTHAPPMGAGLRVLQKNHVVNGCCWLNHSSGDITKKYIELVRKHRCIKAWFSGHFHLGQDYEDSITFPAGNNRGSCVFVQTAVMRSGTTRDGRQQSRLLRGTENGFEVLSVNHAKGGEVRLDATITYTSDNEETAVAAHPSEDYDHEQFFSAYTPSDDDGCEIEYDQGTILEDAGADNVVCWWKLKCGRVLGVHEGMVVEYDGSTLAPLGLVVAKDELAGRKVAVVDSGLDAECFMSEEVGMEGADCVDQDLMEQAVILYDDEGRVTVVQPNEDGSYWRKIVRNKMIRMKEVRREKAAKAFMKSNFGKEEVNLVSSWGPYVTTSGTAKNTGVQGLTVEK